MLACWTAQSTSSYLTSVASDLGKAGVQSMAGGVTQKWDWGRDVTLAPVRSISCTMM